MGITYSSIVDAPRDEVFAWHARPGAMTRLTPPWMPVRIGAEATSLKDARAVLEFPAGLKWPAQHDGSAYAENSRFVDELVSDGFSSKLLATALTWRHTHDFLTVDGDRTKVTDRVESRVPEQMLRQMFSYRHSQLSADLAEHRWAATQTDRTMTVAITGSSGLIGTALSAFLTTGGHRVIRLVRHAPTGPDERRWDPNNPGPDMLHGVDAVIHLAGEPIAGRFTETHKQKIRQSRIPPTKKLAELLATMSDGPTVFITASAIGFYGADRGDEILTEASSPGTGFLADVVNAWESSTIPARQAGVRVVNVRTGIVQSPRGGALHLLRPLFAAGLGGRIGDGQQWQSWIGLDDLVYAYHRALIDTKFSGPMNATAPKPVRNAEYTKILAHTLHRPAILPVPALGPRLLLGREGAAEIPQASQRVLPTQLEATGYQFRHPTLDAALSHQLGRG